MIKNMLRMNKTLLMQVAVLTEALEASGVAVAPATTTRATGKRRRPQRHLPAALKTTRSNGQSTTAPVA